MRRERNETERMTLANSILREARRLIAMVENVLLFSRTGEVGLRPRLEPVAVSELLVDVVEAVQLAVDDAGQAIDADAAPAIAVVGDRMLLRQALVNLVDNAMKYGVAGQHIRLLGEQPSADLVRLVVEDAGRGVPHSERARVFAPYERLARDQVSERTGTGLGLAVVQQIVTACGGRVWLEEASGGGTRAVIELRAATLRDPAPTPVGT
jgi:signal transduction histidine kinase